MPTNPLLEYCGLPPASIYLCEDGLHENHDFFHPGHFAEPIYWDLIWDLEERAIAAGVHEDWEAFHEMFESEDPDLICLDPLIGSTVVALARAGAIPVSSCCGREGHAEDYPLVAFWCPAARLPLIQKVADETGVELYGFDGKHPGLVVSHDDDIHVMRRFAYKLAKRTANAARVVGSRRATGPSRKWSDDELVVCLELYRRLGTIGSSHPELAAIADLLGRSKASIRMRLSNFASLDPDNPQEGLEGAGERARVLWDIYRDQPEALRRDAAVARERLTHGAALRARQPQPIVGKTAPLRG